MKELYTTAELSEMWKVSQRTIYNYRKEGMPFKMLGRSVRFDLSEVSKWIENRQPVEWHRSNSN